MAKMCLDVYKFTIELINGEKIVREFKYDWDIELDINPIYMIGLVCTNWGKDGMFYNNVLYPAHTITKVSSKHLSSRRKYYTQEQKIMFQWIKNLFKKPAKQTKPLPPAFPMAGNRYR